MANTPDVTECAACRRQGDAQLPIDPWRSLAVHFGMLLGVDDFQTVDAYHRGKMWLHSAWLHRAGVVWGLEPKLDVNKQELRIEPGLAIDGCGRELHLDRAACIDLGRWFGARAKQLLGSDPGAGVVIVKQQDGSLRLDAHVLIRFVGCFDRQVPALSQPCDGAGRTTAYSRIFETVELELVPGPAPTERPVYPHLRALFGLPAAELTADQAKAVFDALVAIALLPDGARPAAFEQAFRRFAAIDAAAMKPAALEDGTSTLLPAIDPAAFVLAKLTDLVIKPDSDDFEFVSLGSLDWEQRATHVATRPLEDLLAATLAAQSGGPILAPAPVPPPAPAPPPPPDAPSIDVPPAIDAKGGPRIVRNSVSIANRKLSVQANAPLELHSLHGKVNLNAFVPGSGWSTLRLTSLALGDDEMTITANHGTVPKGATAFRLLIDGGSENPVMGKSGLPLAGADDEPPIHPHTGRHFTHMQAVEVTP